MKNRKFESYILKNRIPGIILSLIMVGCMIIMAWHFSLPDRIRSRTYRSIADVESRANPNDRDVTITVDRADYIGYDYYVDSERQDRYYYCQQDGRYAILLIRSNEDVLLNYTLRGRVVSADDEYTSIVDGLAQDMGIPSQQLESKVYPLIISEVDFPRIYYNMMLLVLVLTALWALYNIVRCIYSVCCPWKVSGMQVVSGGKADRNTVRDIDEQLRYNLYYDQDGIAITDKYLVYHGTWHTDVVELSTIETFKKLRTSANIGPADKKIYKLLMVDVDGVTYEQDFKTEAAIDEALSYLRDSGKK